MMSDSFATITTLHSFIPSSPPAVLDGYIIRGDFSRWIDGVFGDHALGEELRRLEERYRAGSRAETLREIAGAIRARYDLVDDDVATAVR